MKFNNVPTLLLFMVAGLPGCRVVVSQPLR